MAKQHPTSKPRQYPEGKKMVEAIRAFVEYKKAQARK